MTPRVYRLPRAAGLAGREVPCIACDATGEPSDDAGALGAAACLLCLGERVVVEVRAMMPPVQLGLFG